jgi:hypothetical protein
MAVVLGACFSRADSPSDMEAKRNDESGLLTLKTLGKYKVRWKVTAANS